MLAGTAFVETQLSDNLFLDIGVGIGGDYLQKSAESDGR